MSFDWPARKKRSGLPSNGITDRNHNVDLLIGNFVPGFAAITVGQQTVTGQCLQAHRIDLSRGKTSSAYRFEASASPMVQETLSHEATAGIARSENQHRFHHQLLSTFVAQRRPVERSVQLKRRHFMDMLHQMWMNREAIPHSHGCSNLRAETGPSFATRRYWQHRSPGGHYAGM